MDKVATWEKKERECDVTESKEKCVSRYKMLIC